MKLVVLGLSASSAWGNGHATLWRGILRALAREGHDVVFFERDAPYYAQNRDLDAGEGWELVVYPTWEDAAPFVRRAIERADAAIVTSYQADAPRAIEAVLAAPGARVFYDLDTGVTLAALGRGERVPYLPEDGLGDFDLVLSYTGGAALRLLRERLGARRVAPLYGCVDIEAHRPAAPRDEWRADLSYLGTYAADRHPAVERLFLGAAEWLHDARFVLGGPMYPDAMPRPANVAAFPHVPPADHPAFYCSSRFTLNVTRAPMAALGFCPSARLFEAAACGVPIVSDAWPGLDAFFAPEEEIVVAKDTHDVVSILREPCATGARIAARARARTIAEHRAEQRARELVGAIRALPPRNVKQEVRHEEAR